MRYLRDRKGISIFGSTQKRKLRNIGYYHGYKGFRFIGKSTNTIPYTDFKELLAIYEFDMRLKSLLYPQLMFIETALKNYVLEEILSEGNRCNEREGNIGNGIAGHKISKDCAESCY